jgi:uncharacterized membrane protein YphA (DoxX/SURF4 family)
MADTLPLAISRIVAVAAQLLLFFPDVAMNIMRAERNPDFIDPQLLIRAVTAIVPRDVLFTASGITGLQWVTIGAGVLALVGLFTRFSVFVFALGIWIFIAHGYSYGDRHHPQAVFCIFLMMLAFAPSGDRLSLDALLRRRKGEPTAPRRVDTAMWPLKLAHVLLALTYLSTGFTKLAWGGLRWMNGYTLQSYTLGDAINRDMPFGIWLGQQHELAVALSVFTILFETFFFLSIFFPATAPLWFLSGIGFQLGLYFAAGHDFFQHCVLLALLLFFVAPPWWQAVLNRYLGLDLARWAPPERAQPAT